MVTLLRRCVVAVVANDSGQFLVGERADVPGAHQLPQGGVEEGESEEDAVIRELGEEMGNGVADIIRKSDIEVSYLFPPHVKWRSAIPQEFCGQRQRWFLLRYRDGAGPDLTKADGEFSGVCWKSKEEIIAGIVDFKREAYKQGFAALGL